MYFYAGGTYPLLVILDGVSPIRIVCIYYYYFNLMQLKPTNQVKEIRHKVLGGKENQPLDVNRRVKVPYTSKNGNLILAKELMFRVLVYLSPSELNATIGVLNKSYNALLNG